MATKETPSEKLRREAQQLRETAIDLMEHDALLITKSIEIDKKIKQENGVG